MKRLTTFRQDLSPIFTFVLSLPLALHLLAVSVTARPQEKAAYEDWISIYRRSPLRAPEYVDREPIITNPALPQTALRGTAPLGTAVPPILVITAIEGDDLKPDEAMAREVGRDYKVTRRGCFVSGDAGVGSFYISPGPIALGPAAKVMPTENFQRLKTLIVHLPDDHSFLPPVGGRRLVLQFQMDSQVQARVYDRANLPDDILEILRLTECRIASWALKFTPQGTFNAGAQFVRTGSIVASPDGSQIIRAEDGSVLGSARFFDSNSHALVKQIPLSMMPMDTMLKPPTIPIPTRTPAIPMQLMFSPDGSIVLVQDYGDIDVRDARDWRGIRFLRENARLPRLSHPQFTSDGRYLLVASEEPALLVFDTKTWESHAPPPEIPSGAVAYFPSRNGRRAIYVSRTGDIRLWDQNMRRDIAQLDPGGRIIDLTFSPDQSLVAATIVREEIQGNFKNIRDYRFAVWDAKNGRLQREPRAFELPADVRDLDRGAVFDVKWWPDGRYLLGSMSTGIGLWDVKSGRFRATFDGCGSGFAVLPRKRQLAGPCGVLWDVAGAIKAIQQDSSFPRN